jgi:hypothetical protein
MTEPYVMKCLPGNGNYVDTTAAPVTTAPTALPVPVIVPVVVPAPAPVPAVVNTAAPTMQPTPMPTRKYSEHVQTLQQSVSAAYVMIHVHCVQLCRYLQANVVMLVYGIQRCLLYCIDV